MAKKPLYKRLKYKNIAAALAVLLIIILCITSSCNGKKKDNDKDKDKSKPVVTTVDKDKNKPDDSSQPAENPGSTEQLEKNYRYISLSNEQNLSYGDLILVNSDYEYKGAEPADLVSSYDYRTTSDGEKVMSIKDSTVMAKKQVLESLRSMLSDFRKEKNLNDVMLVSGYRTVEYQQELYDENLESTGLSYSTTVETPGHSEHHTGYSLDFQLDQEDYPRFTGEGDYAWINENCYKYGFVQRYPKEKADITGIEEETWHYRYVGAPHAELIYKNGLCLEEYLTSLKQYSREEPLYFNDYTGTRYAIYYVPSSGEESTNVDIPLHENESDYDCVISGNNYDGYIVTVNISSGEVSE